MSYLCAFQIKLDTVLPLVCYHETRNFGYNIFIFIVNVNISNIPSLTEWTNLIHILRVHIRTRSFFDSERENAISKKAKKKGDFWEVECFALFISPQTETQACEQTGDLQHRHSSNLSSSSFRKPGLTSGPAAIWNEESNLCRLLQCSMAHTNDLGRSFCSGGSQWHVSWGKIEVYPLQLPATHVASWTCWVFTENTKLPLISWCVF